MLQVVRMGGGVQAGAGQLVEGWGEQGTEASAGAGVGEMDGVRHQDWRVSIGTSSPASIASSFFFSGAVLLIVCAHIALATALDCGQRSWSAGYASKSQEAYRRRHHDRSVGRLLTSVRRSSVLRK